MLARQLLGMRKSGTRCLAKFRIGPPAQTGKKGEKRVVITMNGKFLPHVEQIAADNTELPSVIPSVCLRVLVFWSREVGNVGM